MSERPAVATGVRRVIDYAHAKSGDKLDRANVGLVCRSEQAYGLLVRILDTDRVTYYLRSFLGDVTVSRHLVPGLRGINFVVESALDGGSLSSRKVDRLAKALSGLLLAMPLDDLSDEELAR